MDGLELRPTNNDQHMASTVANNDWCRVSTTAADGIDSVRITAITVLGVSPALNVVVQV